MKMCRGGARVIAMSFAASLSNSMCFSVRAADLMPIVQGGGYFNWPGLYAGGNLGGDPRAVGRIQLFQERPPTANLARCRPVFYPTITASCDA
jgi:hypothetical protein